jgi:hypothetical protein
MEKSMIYLKVCQNMNHFLQIMIVNIEKQLKYAFAVEKLIFAYGKEKSSALSINQDSIETLDSFESLILSFSQLKDFPITYIFF